MIDKMQFIVHALLSLLSLIPLSRSWIGIADSSEANSNSRALVDEINAYRVTNGLAEIPYSESLSFVAQLHADDFSQSSHGSGCNLHSWSSDGPWTGMCYTSDHAESQAMWDKPREVSRYASPGYEISSTAGSPSGCVTSWDGSPPHRDVILNNGMWASHPWLGVGCSLRTGAGGSCHCWFGELEDPGRGHRCGNLGAMSTSVCGGGVGRGLCQDQDVCLCWPLVTCLADLLNTETTNGIASIVVLGAGGFFAVLALVVIIIVIVICACRSRGGAQS